MARSIEQHLQVHLSSRNEGNSDNKTQMIKRMPRLVILML